MLIHYSCECKNSTATWEDYLVVSYIMKHTITKLSNNPLLGIIQRSWKLLSAQNLHADAYRSLIHNWQNFKATLSPPVGEGIDKQWSVQTVRHSSALQISGPSCQEKHGGNLKSIWKGYILHDSNYMTLWQRQTYRHNKKISGCQRLWGGWEESVEHMEVLGQWKYFVWYWSGRYVLLQTCPYP